MHFIAGEISSSFLYDKEHCPGYSNIEPFLQGSVLKSHFLNWRPSGGYIDFSEASHSLSTYKCSSHMDLPQAGVLPIFLCKDF